MRERSIREICKEALYVLEEASERGTGVLAEDIEGYFIEILHIAEASYDDLK